MRKALHLVILLGSLAWAGYVLAQANIPAAWASLSTHASGSQRWMLAALFVLPSLFAYWVDTHGWIATFGSRRPDVPFGRLFSIRLAGEAVNQSTPFMSLGGEPVKALLVSAEGESTSQGSTAVGAARFVMTLAQVVYVALAVALGLWSLPPSSHRALWAFGVFPGAVGVILAGLVIARLATPARWRQAVRGHRVVRKHQEGVSVATGILDFWRHHPREFGVAFACSLAGWAAMSAEFVLVARVLGHPLRWTDALAMEGLMNSITMATFFLPGNLGSQETGLVYLSGMYGLGGPFGAMMVVLRRLREIMWIFLGLGLLAALSGRGVRRRAAASSAAPPRGAAGQGEAS